ncbi:hypothetical protein CRG98_023987 [Punica granatum]|uniref:Uncharacterized protein n=1 Tax=Punica granatum TaxID=22663 RepID=A0A2I0JH56_PUNGR|nr:hypothetical protein CRG98_023987 [Punica granatum]
MLFKAIRWMSTNPTLPTCGCSILGSLVRGLGLGPEEGVFYALLYLFDPDCAGYLEKRWLFGLLVALVIFVLGVHMGYAREGR